MKNIGGIDQLSILWMCDFVFLFGIKGHLLNVHACTHAWMRAGDVVHEVELHEMSSSSSAVPRNEDDVRQGLVTTILDL